jgi:7,8-dihydropterin-6-yl-methyl-4-(beta-D-ribofuranosyl)aminobenzene 5'-phosphate synthase
MPTPGNARLVEQSLFVESRGGLVVITGCAHPGIVGIVRRVKELADQPVFLAMGGFHLGNASDAELADILADLRELEVGRVAPSHCTGDDAIAAFAEAYQDKFIRSGGGTIITI